MLNEHQVSGLYFRRAVFTLVLVGGLALYSSLLYAGGSDECARKFPKELLEAIQKPHPTLHFVKLDELADDDRQLWLKVHKSKCPGIAAGDFDGTHRKQLVGLLLGQFDSDPSNRGY